MADQARLLELQEQWKSMYQTALPSAAVSKSPSQAHWPVHVDHCFARIILDHTVGINAPWHTKIKSPAYKNMSKGQLMAAIAMSERILDGELDLVELDNGSLAMRGKEKKGAANTSGKEGEKKRKRVEDPTLSDFTDQESTPKKRSKSESSQATLHSFSKPSSPPPSSRPKAQKISPEEQAIMPYLSKIALSHKTAFQKRVLTTLCQVPRGQYTTYALISNHLNSSARAVGNALRNNPFAPMVPCHRVLASGGGIGGFKGKIGRGGQEGENDGEKRSLLRDEGVKFDGKGKVVGAAWSGFR